MNPDEILQCVCQWYRTSLDNLRSANKMEKHFVHARWVAMHLLEEHCSLSRQEIGELVNRDNSTVTYALQNVRYRIDIDPAITDAIRNVTALVKAKQAERLLLELRESALRAKETVAEAVQLLAERAQ